MNFLITTHTTADALNSEQPVAYKIWSLIWPKAETIQQTTAALPIVVLKVLMMILTDQPSSATSKNATQHLTYENQQYAWREKNAS